MEDIVNGDVLETTKDVVETTKNIVSDPVQTAIKVLNSDFTHAFINIVLTILIARIVLKIVNHALDAIPLEKTLIKFSKSAMRTFTYVIVALTILSSIGINTSSLVAMISVISAAFALAAQNSLGNLFGGILLLLTQPFLVGDYVSAGGVEGTVLEIGLLNTRINTVDNKRVSVPNGTISAATITNYSTEGNRRVDIKVTASYDAPVETVKAALLEAVACTNGTLTEPIAPFARLSNYGESSIEYTVKVWTTNQDYWTVYFDLMENIKVVFDRHDIEMTYNHMNVHMMKN